MADYVPVFKPGEDLTMTAAADIVGGRLVRVSGNNTVQETSAATSGWLGIATQDAKSGSKVTVTSGGVQEPTVAAAVVAGDVLIPAADGRVTPIAAAEDYSQVVGIALTAQPTAGQKCRARFIR
ncbi:capsid cement protein [Pseudonocardia sp. NPDC049635]|uniref:capsid cement protein n=1 Tax=Pseudonocardia sp. NPDC049635 TaxID=3155506 RepID=UPI0033C5DF5B